MTRQEAIEAIRASFSRGSSTPYFGDSREDYLAAKTAELEAAVIEPVLATITGESFQYGVAGELRTEVVYAIARHGANWLLFLPGSRAFSLAFGEAPTGLKMLGYSSQDALAEWLG